jgi:hypothetical protein
MLVLQASQEQFEALQIHLPLNTQLL